MNIKLKGIVKIIILFIIIGGIVTSSPVTEAYYTKSPVITKIYYSGTKKLREYTKVTYYNGTSRKQTVDHRTYNTAGKWTSRNVKTYYSTGKIKSQNAYSGYRYAGGVWSSSKREYILYNTSGLRIQKITNWYHTNGKLKQKNTQKYTNGKLSTIERVYYNTSGVVTSKTNSKYNSAAKEVLMNKTNYSSGSIKEYWDYNNSSYNIKYLYANGKTSQRHFYPKTGGSATRVEYYNSNAWSQKVVSGLPTQYHSYYVKFGNNKAYPNLSKDISSVNGVRMINITYNGISKDFDLSLFVNGVFDYDSYVIKYETLINSEILRLVNAERKSKGVNSLSTASNLNKAAIIRANEISKSFSHTRPNGTSFATVLIQSSYSCGYTCGENIFSTSGGSLEHVNSTALTVYNAWKNSPGHYSNMVNGKFKQIGISVKFNKSTTFPQVGGLKAVQIFTAN